MEIASPSSDQYGNWMTMDEVHRWVAPSDESILKVTKWLTSHSSINEEDITDVTSNSDFIKVSTTVGVASQLLGCRYLDYVYDSDDEALQMKVSRMDKDCDYHVPAKVSRHIDFISPTKRFPLVKQIVSQVGAGTVTPSVLKELYKVGDVVGESSDNSQGIASFVRQYYSQTSLLSKITSLFFRVFCSARILFSLFFFLVFVFLVFFRENFWKDYDIEADTVTKTGM